jgi:hypothetical protein
LNLVFNKFRDKNIAHSFYKIDQICVTATNEDHHWGRFAISHELNELQFAGKGSTPSVPKKNVILAILGQIIKEVK